MTRHHFHSILFPPRVYQRLTLPFTKPFRSAQYCCHVVVLTHCCKRCRSAFGSTLSGGCNSALISSSPPLLPVLTRPFSLSFPLAPPPPGHAPCTTPKYQYRQYSVLVFVRVFPPLPPCVFPCVLLLNTLFLLVVVVVVVEERTRSASPG